MSTADLFGDPPPATPLAPSAGPSAPASAGASSTADTFDECTGSKPVPHPFLGILRVARCEQHMYLTMASLLRQRAMSALFGGGVGPTRREGLEVRDHRRDLVGWQVTEPRPVAGRHAQHVPAAPRPDVHERDRGRAADHDRRRRRVVDDRAEDARRHAAMVRQRRASASGALRRSPRSMR